MQPPQQSSCKEYQQDISSLIDNEMLVSPKASLLKHIEKCPFCFLELETQEKIRSLVQNNLDFLSGEFMNNDAKNALTSSIMLRVSQQSNVAESAHHQTHHDPRSIHSRGTGGEHKDGDKLRSLFNPRPLIITSAASLLILVGSSTSMLYSFSSVQHDSLSDGSLVIVVSEIDGGK